MTSTRSPAQKCASMLNGTKSGGPVTELGKAKSALNATRHGVRARRVLLEGESVADYLAEAEVWLQGLEPATDAEVELVFDIIDIRVRLGRVEKAEKARIDAATKKEVSEMPEHQRLKLTQNAVTMLTAMKAAIEHGTTTKAAEFSALIPAVRSVLETVKQAQSLYGSLFDGLVQFEDAITDLFIFTGSEWPTQIFTAISGFIDRVSADLHHRAEVDAQAVREFEIDMALIAVPTNDVVGRRMESYRRLLHCRLESHLDLLEQLRRLRPGGGGSGSFVRPVHLNLRSAPGPQALAHG